VNKPIRLVSIFCLLLFLALAINATYLQYYHASALDDHVGNTRVAQATFSRLRGAILAGTDPVAESVPSKDQYQYQRTYPKPFMYAPLTGWYTFGNQTGLERSDNNLLSGEDDRLFVNRLVDLVNGNATKGGNVVLTINPAAQQAAYDGLKALGPDVQGAVVAIEPRTGKILAMVSLPTYDPNRLATHDFKAAAARATVLNKDKAQPLLNRAIQTTLAPGSTFKLVTAAAAIQSGKYTASSLVPGGATYKLPGSTKVISNEGRPCGTGKIPFAQAMENSCNTSFAQLAVQVGADAMYKQAQAFGFDNAPTNGDPYLQDLPGQATSNFPGNLDAAQTALSGFGQASVTATPLQMAMVSAGIANGGVVMRPYVVDEYESPSLTPLEPGESKPLSQAISSSTASELTKLMVATVQNGTASPAAIPGVLVAGKTGTAQSGLMTGPPGNRAPVPPYAWFTSFAPANDPKVAVAVMIQHVDVPTGEIAGGTLGGPIAKAITLAVLNPHG
jgi:peptidoglycan glycosyltransferase